MKKRFSLPTFLCGTAVLVLLGLAGITWAKANAPLFRVFVICSKASDHIGMSTRAKSLIQTEIYFVNVADARAVSVQKVCLE
jgi:hypothetical protein